MKGGRGKRDERMKENERRTARKEGEREEKGVENRGLKLKGENRDRERDSPHADQLTIHSEQFPTPPTSNWNSTSAMEDRRTVDTGSQHMVY